MLQPIPPSLAGRTRSSARCSPAAARERPANPPTIRYQELYPTWNFDFDDHDAMTRRLPRLAAL
ncbi:hypothetical protein AVW11_35320 [Streptomyces amritsarensis]|uniref:Uncharacterized protein n=1 Tax=Streptomyces amritsarensis TaxID=681158 RepID=A0ABX3FR41_9ACTN|nr:hypothetical protein AVW11_35320 [Streptomyces amritsarensis]